MFDNFYNDTDQYLPDYKYWINMPTWEHNPFGNWLCSQPLLLVMNIDPYTHFTENDLQSNNLYLIKSGIRDGMDSNPEIEKMLTLINLSFEIGDLIGIKKMYKLALPRIDTPFTIKFPKYSHSEVMVRQERTLYAYEMDRIARAYSANVRSYQVKPSAFITWANSKGFRIPKPFKIFLEGSPTEQKPPYQNPDHPYYSKELDAAVKVWMAIYGENQLDKSNPSHISQLEKWLINTYKDDKYILQSNVIERITKLVNVHKKRGFSKQIIKKNNQK